MVKKPKTTPLDRATRRPVPGTSEGWRREVEGVSRFANAKPRLIDANGIKWFKNIGEYYKERLDHLCKNVPRDIPKAEAARIVKDVKSKIG